MKNPLAYKGLPLNYETSSGSIFSRTIYDNAFLSFYLGANFQFTPSIILGKYDGHLPGLLTCPTADICLTADPGVISSILAWSHTFVEFDHEIISMAILFISADSRRLSFPN